MVQNCLFFGCIGGFKVGILSLNKTGEDKGRTAPTVVNITEVKLTAVDNEINHLNGFQVTGSLDFKCNVIICRNNGLPGFCVEHFGDRTDHIGIADRRRNRECLVRTVDERVVFLLCFIPLRIGQEADFIGHISQ